MQTFAITKPVKGSPLAYQEVATGNWTISNLSLGYGPNLQIIQDREHFIWLYENSATNGFTGVLEEDTQPYQGKYSNAEAIQELFIQSAVLASSSLVTGLDPASSEAMLNDVIAPLTEEQLTEDYDQQDTRTLFLIQNYNAQENTGDAVGVLVIDWHLIIKDYEQKDKDGGDLHDTWLKLKCRAVTYESTSLLCTHFHQVACYFKS
ncbi:MAG: hypothetical protein F6K48_02425 [Okeania sp. SIO3H1]|uniref:hypothetical protein n=1 Tax=Okeania sp. SIO1I7 TaxID=2607772 RepID=UPI0013C5705B|nr:hypothetical protein [Okeania sp. SIO1I7]NEN87833.1 hypothetical protein [Okeania sp. SIO3H1]